MEGLIGRYKRILSIAVFLAIAFYTKSLVDSANQQNTLTIPTPTVIPTLTPTVIPTNIPSPTISTKTKENVLDFFYPGATQISFDDDRLILESSDDPEEITDWYKEKFDSFGMRAKAFSQTNVNGNVVNKLVGDNGTIEIRVEITKKKNQQNSKIVVEKEGA